MFSRSSDPPPSPSPRFFATASISSIKIIAVFLSELSAAFLASLNNSLTLAAPFPTYTSTKSLPVALKKGTPASPASALANKVFPVPGPP